MDLKCHVWDWDVARHKNNTRSIESFHFHNKEILLDKTTMSFMSKSKPSHKTSKILPLKSCRICFCDDNQPDMLTKICGCRGSLAHVHRSCIKEWILSSTDFTFSTVREETIYCRTCQLKLQTSKIFVSDQEPHSPKTSCCFWVKSQYFRLQ